jgi:RES domain-containing protein
MLEYFVHLDANDAPPDLVLVTAEIPTDLPHQRVAVEKLPAQWRCSPAPAELAHIGDEFVRRAEHCVLIVPSADAPHENNWLLNPQDAGFRRVRVLGLEPLSYDPRMFGVRRGTRRKA